MPMMALVNPVYDCLFRLAQPDSLNKEEEVGGSGTEGCGGGLPLAQLRMPAQCPWRLLRASLPEAGAWWGQLKPVTVTGHAARSGIYPEQRTAKTYWLGGLHQQEGHPAVGMLSALASCAYRWLETKPRSGGVRQRGGKGLNGISET